MQQAWLLRYVLTRLASMKSRVRSSNSVMKVHSLLGPSLRSAYQTCLAHELRGRGFEVAIEVPVPGVYEGHELQVGYRIDLVVESRVVIEVKSVDGIYPSTKSSSFLTYDSVESLSASSSISTFSISATELKGWSTVATGKNNQSPCSAVPPLVKARPITSVTPVVYKIFQ